MAGLDDVIAKIPRPALVIGVLVLTLALIVSQNPLSDGCDVEVSNFTQNVLGILKSYKKKSGKIQLAELDSNKNLCRQGNSPGSCENYFLQLKKITESLKTANDKCTPKLLEEYPNLPQILKNALLIMSLNAWGEKPPSGVSERMGWLTEAEIYTFCRIRYQFAHLTSEEDYKSLRNLAYQEFPDAWPENISLADRSEAIRPRALKSTKNPRGSLAEEEVFKRSLFSIRCDLFQ